MARPEENSQGDEPAAGRQGSSATASGVARGAGRADTAAGADSPERPIVGVIDDDAAVRDSLKFLLEISGFRVLAYASPAEFLAGSGAEAFSCLLVDQHMPRCTGLELLARLPERQRDVPAALITAAPSPDLRERAARMNVRQVLEKPLDEALLLQFVGEAAGQPRRR